MAHYHFNAGTQYGQRLRAMLNVCEAADDQMTDTRDLMIQMRSGDGSQTSHYDEIAARFGFDSSANARSAFEELDSAYSKISGNGQVTDVRAARDQLFSRLRG